MWPDKKLVKIGQNFRIPVSDCSAARAQHMVCLAVRVPAVDILPWEFWPVLCRYSG